MVTTTSYAQNGEDIVLARGLTAPSGFYVDIGAADPVEDSVTKLFYDRGWRGINVDIVRASVDRLNAERPRDINVCAAITAASGDARVWLSEDVPTHSTVESDIASAHNAGGANFVCESVRALTLADLLDLAVPPEVSIDFLKVDVEGHEHTVLASNDWTRWRPRVVVAEYRAPFDEVNGREPWDSILVDAGYELALDDGLNRFYALAEERDVIGAIGVPANVLDEFEKAGHVKLRRAYEEQLARNAELERQVGQLASIVEWYDERLGRLIDAQATRPASRTSD
jgi:FkbM family methyltransferase